MAKKKFDPWNAEEWLYTEFLQAAGPLSRAWVEREFKKRRHLHGGNPEVLDMCLQRLGIRDEGFMLCPPT